MKKSLATFVILSSLVLQGCVVGVSSVQPPHVGFYGHPSLVVIPGTYVYAMTDVDDDIFFHVGWWWRLWDGRWYKSRYYDRGWSHYHGVPGFYHEVDPGWREFYRHRRWHGHPWTCERIPAPRVQHDWDRWQKSRYWEKERNWGVQGFRPEPYRQTGFAERGRDDAGFGQPDRQRQSRFEDRRRETGMEPGRRREFTREKEPSKAGIPFFGNHRTDDREAQRREGDGHRDERQRQRQQLLELQGRGDERYESRIGERTRKGDDRRDMRPAFERGRQDDGKIETQRDRQPSERMTTRRNRQFFDQGREESGAADRQERGQFREDRQDGNRSPLFERRQREARTQGRQRAQADGGWQPQPESRQQEEDRIKPERRQRDHDAHDRSRPQRKLPAEEPGEGGTPAPDTSGVMQNQ